jgi:aryl-alcohol dehydrogenase-like predicted oxidoreductase
MEYRILGKTGVRVSELCLGCMTFGGRTEEAESIRMIDRALDAGINFIDTANVYNRGRSEEVTGKALQGKRDQIFLATKVHGRMGDAPNDVGNSRYHIVHQVEQSLKRLNTDRIDLYYLHRPDPDTAIEEEVRAMDDLVHQGKILYAGTSHYPAWLLYRALAYSEKEGLAPFVADQPRYNVACRQIEAELLPFSEYTGYGVVPHSPLYGGVLSGKYAADQQPPPDSRGANPGDDLISRLTEKNLRVARATAETAAECGKSTSQVAIQFTLANPQIDSIIIGPRTMEQLEDNLGSVGWNLSPEELEMLNELEPPVIDCRN